MKLIEKIHGSYIHQRRVESLKRGLASVLPDSGTLLDVGCGDGLLASLIGQQKPGLSIKGIDVLVRDETRILVDAFDGETMPYGDDAFDVVMFVDVLHHTDHPEKLLAEARRVARQWVVLKDHNCNGWFAHSTLRFMDRVGNQRFGVELPFNYLTRERWREVFQENDLRIETYIPNIDLYPMPLKPLFERQLHFIARLELV
ncbi:MAG: class I SAM-dependent methyltransferase [Planctomycetota bacterium]